MNINTGTNVITSLSDTDIVYIGRPSATDGSRDLKITGANLKTDIASFIDSWISKTTVDGATDVIGIGAIANYTGFRIDFTISDGTNVTIGFIFLTYSNSLAKATSPDLSVNDVNIKGSAGAGRLFIEQCDVSSGQFRWRITNNLGVSITTQYKVTQYPA